MPVSASKVLPPKPALRARMWRFGKLGDEGDLEGVLDGGRAADRGQEEFEAGEILEPAAEFGLEAESASADRARSSRLPAAGRIRASSSRQRRWRDCGRESCRRLRSRHRRWGGR